MPIIPIKFYIYTFLVLCLFSFGLYLGCRVSRSHSKTQNVLSNIHTQTEAISVAHKQTQNALAHVNKLKPLEKLITVGTYLTADTISALKIREDVYLSAISKLKIEVQTQTALIETQKEYIILLKHKVIIYKVISSLAVILLIVVLV